MMITIMIKLIIFIFTMVLSTQVSSQETAVIEEVDTKVERKCHKFSHESWLQVSQTCRVCHVLHDESIAIRNYTNGLFWTRNIRSIVYEMYHSSWGASLVMNRDTSLTSSATGRQGNLPDGLSKLCLSCHDGLIAQDVFTLHHFVSVEYDISKTTLREPEITPFGLSGIISDVLDAGVVQCSSCHDVHGEESIANTRLLRVEKTKICFICHRFNIDSMNKSAENINMKISKTKRKN